MENKKNMCGMRSLDPIPPQPNKKSPFEDMKYRNACLSELTLDEGDAQVIFDWLKNPKDIFFIYSIPGTGKTHLMAAITHHYLEKKKPCLYLKEKDFIQKLRDQISEGFSEEAYLKYMCENPLIILDDICSTRDNNSRDGSTSNAYGMTEWQKDMLFTFLDYRVNSRLPTIITSNHSPKELEKFFHERFISRLTASNNVILLLKGTDKRKEGL